MAVNSTSKKKVVISRGDLHPNVDSYPGSGKSEIFEISIIEIINHCLKG